MTTHAINTGAFNVVPFPASEVGVSVVDLLGTVQVVCTLSAVTLLLTVGAATAPKSTLTASTTAKMLLAAPAQPSAVAGNISPKQKTYRSASTSASASTAAGVVLLRKTGATAQPQAVTTLNPSQLVKRSASSSGAAVTSANAYKYQYRSITATATAATSSIVVKNKVAFAIAQKATVVSSVSYTFKSRLPATTIASATAQSGVLSFLSLKALTTSPTGQASAAPRLLMHTELTQLTALALTASVPPRVKLSPLANSVSATATGQNITVSLHHQMTASTVARAYYYAIAIDYATQISAPSERQIVVPSYDRMMKVV